MKVSNWLKILGLSMMMMGPAGTGCSSTPGTAVTATSRQIRGKVRLGSGARTVTSLVLIDARTKQRVQTAAPDAQGNFVFNNVTKGKAYRIISVIGKRSVPLTFPRQAGRTGKTNVFRVANKACAGTATCDDAPIDLGELVDHNDAMDVSFGTDDAHNPALFSDTDSDGIPDATDPDLDGDGTPNAMDRDDDNNGMDDTGDPASAQGSLTQGEFGDSDGDGLTNEADPDADGDGTENSIDTDDDGNGTPDAMEADTDHDGTPNAMDDDINGDGVDNSSDAFATGDGDEGDGSSDMTFHGDMDGDGIPNTMDNDVDNDGIPNALDHDSTDDGTMDAAPAS